MQVLFSAKAMPTTRRKKLKIAESNYDLEIVEVPLAVKVEIVYEDTKAITGAEPELK